jgi:cell division protein FtsW
MRNAAGLSAWRFRSSHVEDEQKKVMGYDYTLLIPTLILLCFGLIMTYSASSFLAAHRYGDSYYFLKRQATFCIMGIFCLILAKNIPTQLYQKYIYPILIISFGLLVLVLIPGLGVRVGGASRWLRFAGFAFQPAEMAKLSLALYLAYSMAKKGPDMALFSKGFLPHLIVAGLFMVLIVIQPDLGSCIIIGTWLVLMLFVGGVKLWHLASLVLCSLPMIFWLIWRADYRLKRWYAFLNPWEDPQGLGYHIIHSFLAFGSGGFWGLGLGNSKQKLFYLPEPHTDFIFSITAEELGWVGGAVLIVLFSMIILRGIIIALNARDLYSSYLAMGISTFLGLQVLINLGVVMGLLPTKGLTLPLMSYGGSSLVVTLFSIGVLLNISAEGKRD